MLVELNFFEGSYQDIRTVWEVGGKMQRKINTRIAGGRTETGLVRAGTQQRKEEY